MHLLKPRFEICTFFVNLCYSLSIESVRPIIFRPAFGCTHIVYFHQLSGARYSKVPVVLSSRTRQDMVWVIFTLQFRSKYMSPNHFMKSFLKIHQTHIQNVVEASLKLVCKLGYFLFNFFWQPWTLLLDFLVGFAKREEFSSTKMKRKTNPTRHSVSKNIKTI